MDPSVQKAYDIIYDEVQGLIDNHPDKMDSNFLFGIYSMTRLQVQMLSRLETTLDAIERAVKPPEEK